MAYTDIHDAATNSDHVLRKQVFAAIHKAAVDVINEDAGTANHAARLHWARGILNSVEANLSEAASTMGAVLQNVSIQSAPTTSTDNDVQFAVNALVNTLANR
jgi:hypothetical protein